MLNKMTLKLGVAMAMLLVVGSAFAQGGGGGQGRGLGGQRGMIMGGGGQGSLQLLTRKDVQDDLVITAEQKKKIDELNTASQADRQKMMEDMRNGGGQPDMEAMRAAMDKARKANDEKVKAILTAEQQKRLKEIRVQIMGNRAIMDEEVQKDLGLTADQKSKIKKIQDKQQQDMRDMMEDMRNSGGQMDREAMQAAMQKAQDKVNEEMAKVLTAEQTTKLKEMGGKPFKSTQQPGGRRGGGGGGGF